MTHNEVKKAKFRFAALYGLSVILIFLLVMAFWRKTAGAVQPVAQTVDGDGYFIQFDTLLHAKSDRVDSLYALYLKSLQNGNAEPASFLMEKNNLATTLDSIAQQASVLSGGAKKNAMELIVARFRSSLEIKDKLINELTYLPKNKMLPNNGFQDSSSGKNELENLKGMLVEKEQKIAALEQSLQSRAIPTTGSATEVQKQLTQKNNLIASLQTQLKQKDEALQRALTATPNNSGGTSNEWKQKYTSLKASYDRVVDSEKMLRSAYKTVVDDNKRLLGQLQSSKKG